MDPELLSNLATFFAARARLDAPLGELTTYRVGGRAAILITVESIDDLLKIHEIVGGRKCPFVVLGRGSNMLVADRGFPGVVLRWGAIGESLRIPDTDSGAGPVEAGALAFLPVVARRTAHAGLTGFEWAVGVPGSIGGAVRMNAGGHGADIASSLVEVDLFDLDSGRTSVRPVSELGLRFRGSNLGDSDVVVRARLHLERGSSEESLKMIEDIVRWRRENQPGGQNAGSVFVNPVPGQVSAGELIDRIGLRGFRIGSAEVSTKHANFIQADEGGRAGDVHAVMCHVREKVLDSTGFDLRSEVRLIGFDEVLT
ncbi:MAG: UDP-N-acetylenolpyruvoylglucosamine reductase [Actinomycetota bacterium]|jgi:UDP-N-acetylmuramate dehydrogenase